MTKWCISIGLVSMTAMAGCGNPQQKLFMAEQSYVSLGTVILTARAQKLIPDTTWQEIAKADNLAWAALQAYRLSVEGGSPDAEMQAAFETALAQLRTYYNEIFKESK